MSLDVLVGDGRPSAPASRRPVVVAVVVGLLALALFTWASWPKGSSLPLDPESPAGDGTRALVQVLRQQGVRVDVVRDRSALGAAQVDDRTTLVASAGPMVTTTTLEALDERLADAGHVVLLGMPTDALVALDLPVRTAGGSADPVAASCSDPIGTTARRIGPVTRTYTPMTDDERGDWVDPFADPEERTDETIGRSWQGLTTAGCYPVDSGHALLTVRADDMPRIDLLAPSGLLTNDVVTTESDAALGLRLLGSLDRVVWFAPDRLDAEDDATSVEPRVAPRWLMPLLLLLLGALGLTMWWRGRRLGPLAVEPLPVLVHAAETTTARGRLYRKAGASGAAHGAESLRAATTRRLVARLALPRDSTLDDVVTAVATATGRTPDAVRELLGGAAPTDGASLATLATDLRQLEREVRHP